MLAPSHALRLGDETSPRSQSHGEVTALVLTPLSGGDLGGDAMIIPVNCFGTSNRLGQFPQHAASCFTYPEVRKPGPWPSVFHNTDG